MKKIFFSLSVFFVLLSTPCFALGEWNLTGSCINQCGDFDSVVLDDGRTLKVGGNIYGEMISTCEIRDKETGLWTLTDSMAFGRAGKNFLIKLPDGRVLATGFGGPNHMSEIWSPITGLWSFAGAMNYLHEDHCLILITDASGNVYVLAVGGDLENDYKGCEIWNPTTETWSITGFLPVGKRCFAIVLLPNGDALAVGGGLTTYEECAIYNHLTEEWSETEPLNQGRFYLTLEALSNGDVRAIAGINGNTFEKSCEIRDFQTGIWTFVDSLEIGRGKHSSPLLLNKQTLAVGGIPGTACLSCEIFSNGEWQMGPSLTYSMGQGKSVILSDERVLGVGQYFNQIYTWNYQPTVSQPQGPNQGMIGENLIFSVVALDPDLDSTSVKIDWGNGEISEWTELQPSGSTFILSHEWIEPGTYEIRAQSADQWYFLNDECHNSLSEWGDTLIVTISGQSTDQSMEQTTFLTCYPNPFKESTTLSFHMPAEFSEHTYIVLYNVKGQEVRILECGNHFTAASSRMMHSITWDGRDENNQPVGSGIYFFTLKSGEKVIASKKMILLR